MLKQRTLKTVIRAAGVGLHGGVKVSMTLRPAMTSMGELGVVLQFLSKCFACTTIQAAQGVESLKEAGGQARDGMKQLADSSLLRLKNWVFTTSGPVTNM